MPVVRADIDLEDIETAELLQEVLTRDLKREDLCELFNRLTAYDVAHLLKKAGLPDGIVQQVDEYYRQPLADDEGALARWIAAI